MLQATETPLWRRWVVANAVGELVGLGLTFMVGFGLFASLGEEEGAWAAIIGGALMAATGLIEGTVVGLAQWQVLRTALSGVRRWAWWRATLFGAMVAWLLGALPSTLIGMQADPAAVEATPEPSLTLMLIAAAAMGAVLGPILALPQWLVLRRHVARAAVWIPANSAGWALGMPLIFAGINAAQTAPSLALALLVMVMALLLTGAVAGAVHGIALVLLVARRYDDT